VSVTAPGDTILSDATVWQSASLWRHRGGLDQRVMWYGSQAGSVAHPSACMRQSERRTLWT